MFAEALETGEVTVPELGDADQESMFYEAPTVESIATLVAEDKQVDRYYPLKPTSSELKPSVVLPVLVTLLSIALMPMIRATRTTCTALTNYCLRPDRLVLWTPWRA